MSDEDRPPRRVAVIDGAAIRGRDDFYDALSRALALPAWFGRNLDALWDSLTGDVAGPLDLVWTDSQRSRQALGADFDRIVAVLREVEVARADFRLRLV
ncbi:MAG TPA: barstar family protein [Alphaproteobacteria bacterium]|nr:barstar family protein [Alphaproteobacteria bacterium]